jgi:predicted DNA-binding ribbon-helix-helix protein
MQKRNDRARYDSTLENYNLRIAGRWTTARLEPPIMEALHAIARTEGQTIHELCTGVLMRRGAGSAISALRQFAISYYRERCEAAQAAGLSTPSGLVSEILTYRNLHLETSDQDYMIRNDIELDEAHRENAGLGFLLAYWRALSGSGAPPPASAIELGPVDRIGFLEWTHIIDVSATDPDDFRNLRQAPGTVIYRRPNLTPLRAMGKSIYVQSLKNDYTAVKWTRRPVFQRVAVKSPEGSIRYHRLMLPWAAKDGTVERLVVGVYPIEPQARRATSRRG